MTHHLGHLAYSCIHAVLCTHLDVIPTQRDSFHVTPNQASRTVYASHTTAYPGGYELTQNDASCTQNRLKLAAASSRKMYKLKAKCYTLYHFESTFACIWSSIVGSHFLNNFVKVRKYFFFLFKHFFFNYISYRLAMLS